MMHAACITYYVYAYTRIRQLLRIKHARIYNQQTSSTLRHDSKLEFSRSLIRLFSYSVFFVIGLKSYSSLVIYVISIKLSNSRSSASIQYQTSSFFELLLKVELQTWDVVNYNTYQYRPNQRETKDVYRARRNYNRMVVLRSSFNIIHGMQPLFVRSGYMKLLFSTRSVFCSNNILFVLFSSFDDLYELEIVKPAAG